MKKQKKIPKFKNEEEMVSFWDSQNFTDFIDDTEPVDETVFDRPKKIAVSIRLEQTQVKELKRLAHRIGLNYSSLVRSWVTEKLSRTHRLKKK